MALGRAGNTLPLRIENSQKPSHKRKQSQRRSKEIPTSLKILHTKTTELRKRLINENIDIKDRTTKIV